MKELNTFRKFLKEEKTSWSYKWGSWEAEITKGNAPETRLHGISFVSSRIS